MSTRLEPSTTDPTRSPGVRLNFGSVFVPVGLLTLGFLVLATRSMIRRQLGPGRWHLASLLLLTYMPRLGFYAFLVATIVSVGADLTVRLVVAPMVYQWLRPPEAADAFATPVEFALASRESIVEQTPARRLVGRRWEPGRLILTTDRLGFAPRSWDAETRWTPRRDLAHRPGRPAEAGRPFRPRRAARHRGPGPLGGRGTLCRRQPARGPRLVWCRAWGLRRTCRPDGLPRPWSSP